MMNMSKRTIEAMWADFADCPINDMEEILESFCGWPVFTDREEIWRWFDEQYAEFGCVHALMFPDEHKKSKYGRVMANVTLQAWRNDYAIDLETIEFDCGRALDELPIERVEKLESGKAGYDTDEVFTESVFWGLVDDHDGPFDCYIDDGDELAAYIEKREKDEGKDLLEARKNAYRRHGTAGVPTAHVYD